MRGSRFLTGELTDVFQKNKDFKNHKSTVNKIMTKSRVPNHFKIETKGVSSPAYLTMTDWTNGDIPDAVS